MAKTAVLVVAAGRGRRFGADLPKQYHLLNGVPVLRHCLARFAADPQIAVVRTVIHPDDLEFYQSAAAGLALAEPVFGGAERQDSVRLGLESLADLQPDLVLIHDGARPFVDTELIGGVLSALTDCPCALPAIAVSDTLKRGSDGMVVGNVDRSGLWRAQTPQGFRFPEILAAHRACAGLQLTDDAAVAEHAGLPVVLTPGNEGNVKITSVADLARAQDRFAAARRRCRIGTGYDVHRFCDGDGVWLGGVRIKHDYGLEGHSDADAALHALTDAVLGAAACGDIGAHFPPSDPQWRGASSDRFLAHAAGLVRGLGGDIVNVDLTIICERPKIGPHRDSMRKRIAEILNIPMDAVSVKATTTEKLGFTGRGEGIAAEAVAMVEMPG